MQGQNITEVREGAPRLALNAREAADSLSISNVTLYRLLKNGSIRSSAAVRRKIIPIAELQRFLTASLA